MSRCLLRRPRHRHHHFLLRRLLHHATRLHNRLVYAWKAAYGATREAQGATVSNTAATSIRGQREFQVGDRVVPGRPTAWRLSTRALTELTIVERLSAE